MGITLTENHIFQIMKTKISINWQIDNEDMDEKRGKIFQTQPPFAVAEKQQCSSGRSLLLSTQGFLI